jgi:hypothetical protein
MKDQKQPEKTTPPDDEREDEYVDFASPKAVKAALKEAFKTYAWPEVGCPPRTKSWIRKKGKLVPRVRVANDRVTSKFKIQRVEKLIALLGMGMYFEQACTIVGVRSRVVLLWIERGEKEGKGPYWIFARAVQQIAAGVEANCAAVVHRFIHAQRAFPTKDAADMALKFLERRFPKRWRAGVDVTTDGKPLPAEGGRGLREITVKFVDAATATQDPQPPEAAEYYDETAPVTKTIFDA